MNKLTIRAKEIPNEKLLSFPLITWAIKPSIKNILKCINLSVNDQGFLWTFKEMFRSKEEIKNQAKNVLLIFELSRKTAISQPL